LVFGRGTTVRRGNLIVDGASFHVIVEVGASKAPELCHLGERLSTPPPLDTMRYSSAESMIMAHCKVDTPL
jgi:hypothetical protein